MRLVDFCLLERWREERAAQRQGRGGEGEGDAPRGFTGVHSLYRLNFTSTFYYFLHQKVQHTISKFSLFSLLASSSLISVTTHHQRVADFAFAAPLDEQAHKFTARVRACNHLHLIHSTPLTFIFIIPLKPRINLPAFIFKYPALVFSAPHAISPQSRVMPPRDRYLSHSWLLLAPSSIPLLVAFAVTICVAINAEPSPSPPSPPTQLPVGVATEERFMR